MIVRRMGVGTRAGYRCRFVDDVMMESEWRLGRGEATGCLVDWLMVLLFFHRQKIRLLWDFNDNSNIAGKMIYFITNSASYSWSNSWHCSLEVGTSLFHFTKVENDQILPIVSRWVGRNVFISFRNDLSKHVLHLCLTTRTILCSGSHMHAYLYSLRPT